MGRPSGRRLIAILALGAAAYTAGSMFQPAVVVGESMAPTLGDGKVIYVDRTHYRTHRPRAGEVVVFVHQESAYVKRVYRGPGEMVHYVSDGQGFVNLVREDRVEDARRRYGAMRSPLRVVSRRVPDDCVWVLGDNFFKSEDSRQLGPIPIRELLGRARVEVDTTIARRNEHRPRRPLRAGTWAGTQAAARGRGS